jgi:AcrR family transcriptional regulator
VNKAELNKKAGLTVCLEMQQDGRMTTAPATRVPQEERARVPREERARVPQEERTRAMRQRLLEATVDCLVEHGWSGTSTTLVSKRAGVSRGAQLHHFPTKDALVVAAVEHLTEVRGAEIADAAERLPSGRRRTRAVLEMLADHFTSPVFTAALELWVAARTDQSLHRAVGPLEQRVGREIHRQTVELLGVDEHVPGVRELVQATLDLVRGLGLANTISDDTARRKRILDEWARVLDAQLPTKEQAADD